MNMNAPCLTSRFRRLMNESGIALCACLLLTGCGGGDSQDPDPLVSDFGIAFVMAIAIRCE